MKIIKHSIQNGVSLAYISLLRDLTDLLSSPLTPNISQIDKDLGMIKDDIYTYFLKLDPLEDNVGKSNIEYASELQAYQIILEDRFKTINAYSREINHISSILENNFYLITTENKDIEGINYHQFIHEGLDFINQEITLEERTYRIREFLRLLPIRITQDIYCDYVRQSLSKVAVNPSDKDDELFTSIFQQMFDGRVAEGYGKFFPDIHAAVEDFRQESTKNLSAEDIEEVFDDIYLLTDTISNLYNLIATMHRIISSLSILIALPVPDIDIVFHEHVAYKDLFYTTKSLITGVLQNEEHNIMLETLPARLSDIYDQVNDSYNKTSKIFYNNLEKKVYEQNNEADKLVKLFSLIQYYLTLNVEDAFSFNESNNSSFLLADSTIDSCISFLYEEFEKLPVNERKLRMQYLISVLPFIMDDQEFASYFNDSIEATSNPIQKAYILAKISTFMDSLGFFDNP